MVRNSEFQSRRNLLLYTNDYELPMQYETYKSTIKNLDLRKVFSSFISVLYVPYPPVCHNALSVEVTSSIRFNSWGDIGFHVLFMILHRLEFSVEGYQLQSVSVPSAMGFGVKVDNNLQYLEWEGPRWHSAVLQIGRSLFPSQLVSLEFFIDIKSFRSHYGPEVYSASNRNEYQEHFLGV